VPNTGDVVGNYNVNQVSATHESRVTNAGHSPRIPIIKKPVTVEKLRCLLFLVLVQ
jgi:hypothetical protein